VKRVEIELGGVKVRAVLYEDRAPVTVAAFWKCLPYEDRVTHGKWSGQMFHTNTAHGVCQEGGSVTVGRRGKVYHPADRQRMSRGR